MDVDQAAKAMKDAEIENFIEGFKQPTYRGMKIDGVRVGDLVIPAWVEWYVRPALVFMTLPHVQDGDNH